MKQHTRMLLIALLVAAWVIPTVRLTRFLPGAWRTYQDEQSLNAWNDFAYGVWLAGAYAVCLAVPPLILLLRRMPAYLGLLLLAGCLLVAGDVIWRHPEEVIVLFPAMHPLRPVGWTALAAFVVGLLGSRQRETSAKPT
jgi:hypothetical protein